MSDQPSNEAVELVILPRISDLGSFEVHRALPSRKRHLVGPFIFWDAMGPATFKIGDGVDVRPHPHIGLSTVTYLFDGSIDHRDSLGNAVRILPGDVNLMTAGRGITHSERTGAEVRAQPSKLYGIQSWLAQPKTAEENAPSFNHTEKQNLPFVSDSGMDLRVILGRYENLVSPTATEWETLYLDVALAVGASFAVPLAEERAVYLLEGSVSVGSTTYPSGQMIVLRPGVQVTLRAAQSSRLLILGGAAMDGPRFIDWNFVSSSPDRIAQARDDWTNGRFAKVPGDEIEFIPLPEQPANVRLST